MKNIIAAAAIALGFVAITMSWQASQKLLDQCVVTERDSDKSILHTYRLSNLLTGDKMMPPRSTKDFYQERLNCIQARTGFGIGQTVELTEFAGLRYVEDVSRKDGKLCATLATGEQVCAR